MSLISLSFGQTGKRGICAVLLGNNKKTKDTESERKLSELLLLKLPRYLVYLALKFACLSPIRETGEETDRQGKMEKREKKCRREI